MLVEVLEELVAEHVVEMVVVGELVMFIVQEGLREKDKVETILMNLIFK